MTIGNKALINILVLCVLAMTTYGYFFLKNEKEYAESQMISRTKAFGESMREIIEANLESENWSYLKKLLNRITVFEQPMGLRVFLNNGELFYQTKSLKDFPKEDIKPLLPKFTDSESLVETKTFKSKAILVSSYRIESKDGTLEGLLQIFDSQAVVDKELRGYQRNVFTSLMIFYALTLSIVLYVVRKNIHQPIESFMKEVQKTSPLFPPIPQKGHELAILKQEFNRRDSHLEQLKNVLSESSKEKEALKDQLKQSEKLAAIGKFAADLAHEMGSPLSVIEGRAAQSLQKIEDTTLTSKNLNLILTQSKRLSHMIEDVLTFARKRPLNKTTLDLNRLIPQALELFSEPLLARTVVFKQAEDLPKIEGDPDQLLQVLINLIRNAIEATETGGTISLTTSQVRDQDERLPWVRLSIKDDGKGMEPATRARLFEPFFSEGKEGQGTGLGLSIVYGIVQEHQGSIRVQSEPGKGSQFDLFLPTGLKNKSEAG